MPKPKAINRKKLVAFGLPIIRKERLPKSEELEKLRQKQYVAERKLTTAKNKRPSSEQDKSVVAIRRFFVTRKRQTAAFEWRTVRIPPLKQSRSYRKKTPKIAPKPYSGVRIWAFLRFGSKSAIRQQKGGASYAPYAEIPQERMGVLS